MHTSTSDITQNQLATRHRASISLYNHIASTNAHSHTCKRFCLSISCACCFASCTSSAITNHCHHIASTLVDSGLCLIRPHLRQPSPPPESPSATARVATRSSRITSTRPKRFFASLDHPTLPRSLPTNNFSQFHKTKFRMYRLPPPPTPYSSLVCVVVVKCTSAKRRGRKAPLLATFSSGHKYCIPYSRE